MRDCVPWGILPMSDIRMYISFLQVLKAYKEFEILSHIHSCKLILLFPCFMRLLSLICIFWCFSMNYDCMNLFSEANHAICPSNPSKGHNR